MKFQPKLLIFLFLIALLSVGISIMTGSAPLGFENSPLLHQILFSIRLPRVLSAFVTGGLLALAGALMQILLRNPLADPYVLGISGGAAVTTLLLLLMGMSGLALIGGTWVGCLMSIAFVFLIAQRNNAWNSARVLLTGIALASGFSALLSFILLTSPEKELRSMLFWLIGDLSYAHYPAIESLILVMGCAISILMARELNILLRGEREAKSLGVQTERLQITLYFLSSALTAAAVTLAGCVGFVGLITPHALRLLKVQDQRYLLPASVLLGGTFLTIADTVARTVWSPQQLPVGIIMALIGVPVFLVLLQKNQ